jgi:hypothetical protein
MSASLLSNENIHVSHRAKPHSFSQKHRVAQQPELITTRAAKTDRPTQHDACTRCVTPDVYDVDIAPWLPCGLSLS